MASSSGSATAGALAREGSALVSVVGSLGRTEGMSRAHGRPSHQGSATLPGVPSRRTLLLGVGGVLGTSAVVAATDVLPLRVRSRFGFGGEQRVALPDVDPGLVEVGRLATGAIHRTAYPPGSSPGDPLPVCLVLHGRGGDSGDAFESHGLQLYLAQVVAQGVPPFVLAAVDGGDAYWHRRRDGRDPEAALQDLLHVLKVRGHPVDRVALMGWSMGGYGALSLGAKWGRDRVASILADSAAMFSGFTDARPGAFDDESDYKVNDVSRRLDVLRTMTVRLSCGRDDPFAAAVSRLARNLPDVQLAMGPGGHTVDYWRSVAAAGLRFVGATLD